MRRYVALISATTVLLVLGGAAGAAWADRYKTIVPNNYYGPACARGTGPSTGTVCQTDNGQVSVYLTSQLTSMAKASVRTSLNESYDGTASLSVSYPSTLVDSGAGETDIIYISDSKMPGSGFVGYTWCDDPVDGSRYGCDSQYVDFLKSYDVHRSLACHETGHAVGLVHGQDSFERIDNKDIVLGCMRLPDTSSDSGSQAYIGENNLYWINYYY